MSSEPFLVPSAERERDSLERFVFEELPIQGRIVHLDSTWRAILERRNYPDPVRDILGEFMAAAVLLTATLKFDGRLTMQVQGNGPIKLLVVECSSERTLRGLAQWDGDIAPLPLPQLLGGGHLAITIDPLNDKERYQGIVELDGDNVAEVLEGYFLRSEQLATRIWLAADGDQAAGMLLQRLPEQDSPDADAWDRATHLGATITRTELLGLSTRDILHRLYHEEDIRLFPRTPVSFRCSCNRSGVENVLRMLGADELHSILEEKGLVAVDCEFCGHHYELDKVEIEQLLASGRTTDTPPTKH